MTRLLLSRRVPWRLLLPGAVVSAVAQVLTAFGGSIWVPILLERNTDRYGVIGAAIGLISWLVVLAFMIVISAVLGAQLGPVFAGGWTPPSTAVGGESEARDASSPVVGDESTAPR